MVRHLTTRDMRDIKFRGKRIDNGEWVYGYYRKIYFPLSEDHRITPWDHESCVDDEYEVDPLTIGEFTGLQDKNGKDIYEGDVIRCVSPNDSSMVFETDFSCSLTGGISFGDHGLIQDSVLYDYELPNELEIIGTVHDKELTH